MYASFKQCLLWFGLSREAACGSRLPNQIRVVARQDCGSSHHVGEGVIQLLKHR